jgi:methionine salvage enolase-phosphatase E1
MKRSLKRQKLQQRKFYFSSDIPEEITAALAAGMEATQVIREGTQKVDKSVVDFNQVTILNRQKKS